MSKYDKMLFNELKVVAQAKGVLPESGSGKGGAITKADVIEALEAADRTAKEAPAPAVSGPVSQELYQYDTEYEVLEPFGGYEKGDVVMNLGRDRGLAMVKAGMIRKKRGGLEGVSNPRPIAAQKTIERRERARARAGGR